MIDFDKPGSDGDVLSKADEFIKRRRAQISSVEVDIPLYAEPADDFPLLTEVVGETGLPALPPHDDLSSDIARELDVWLDENLPQVVLYAMDGITDKLIQQIHESVREHLLPRLKRKLGDDAEPGKQ